MRTKKQVVAVDLDDVLSATVPAFIKFSNKRWDMDIALESYSENWTTTWRVEGEELIKRTAIIKDEFWHTVPHREEARLVLKRLAKKYKLVIATSRRTEVNKATREWIDKYFDGIFEEVHHSGIFDVDKRRLDMYNRASEQTKARLFQELGADFIIDDHPKHCIGADAIGITAILFGDYPWNDYSNLPSGVIRAKTWKEIGEYFARLIK